MRRNSAVSILVVLASIVLSAGAKAQLWAIPQKDQAIIPPVRTIPATFFCTHAPLTGPQNGPKSPPLQQKDIAGWPGAGYRIFGGMPPCNWTAEHTEILGAGILCWGGVEYSAGEWRWDPTDTGLDVLRHNLPRTNGGLLVNLKDIPPRAASNPGADGLVWAPQVYRGCSSTPKDMAGWREYLRRLTMRYRGVVQYYETPNEANHEMKLAPGQILEMNRAIYEAVKRNDPKATVVGPAAAGTPTMAEWVGEYMRIGGKDITDIVSCHFYGQPESVVTTFAQVKAELRRAGAGNKPIWNTESGYFPDSQEAGGPDKSVESRRAKIVRSALLQWAVGIERWYLFGEVNKTPDKQAFDVARRWMAGAKMIRCAVKNRIWECDLERNSRSFMIVWAGPKYPFQLEEKLEYPQNAHFQVPSRYRRMETITGESTLLTARSIAVSPAPILLLDR